VENVAMPPSDSVGNHDELILEGIVVTQNPQGTPNIAPLGPRVDRRLTRLTLRPFQTSQTFRNLAAVRCGVLHVTDDVELLARAAIGSLDPLPPLTPAPLIDCPRLVDCCRWFAFTVDSLDDSSERAALECRIVASGEVRPFFGFNRAKHAVLEAAILATRVGILPADEIRQEFERLAIPVHKTAGIQEQLAFQLLRDQLHTLLNPQP
jgi:uncharacterized protein